EMICTGAIIDGRPPVWPFSEACGTPEEGRAAVKKLADAGVNQLKVYSMLKGDVYLAIAGGAKKRGLKFVGHIPGEITVEDALAAGQYTVEHLTRFGEAVARLADHPTDPGEAGMAAYIADLKAWQLYPQIERGKLEEFVKRVAK